MTQRIKPPVCMCNQCRHHFKCTNNPGERDSKREYKSRKNKERYLAYRTRIKKLRQQKGEEIYTPLTLNYTD